MKARLKQLREKAGSINKQIQAKAAQLGEEGRSWSTEDETEWTRLNAEYDQTADQIDKLERALKLDERMGQPAGDGRVGRDDTRPEGRRKKRKSDPDTRDAAVIEREKRLAFRSWLTVAADRDLSRDQVGACRALNFNPRKRGLVIPLGRSEDIAAMAAELRTIRPDRQQRALSAITGSAGGVTVPTGFLNQLERNMLFYGNALQEFTIMRTDSGNPLPMPYADDTSNEGEIVGESADMDGSTDPTFGARTLGAYKFSSKMVKIPIEFIEDGAFDVVGYVAEILGERLGRVKNRKGTLGTGVKMPRGYMVAAALGVTAASATQITGDELTVDLVHSVDPAYREGATYAMHDTVLAHIRKLKDGAGRPLFQSNLAEGFPDTIDGRRFWINQHMDSGVTTGKKPVAFGNFKKVIWREVRSIRMVRLDERYAEKDQVAFLAIQRGDGDMVDAGTPPVKYLQMA
ncbi:MAG: phage major capsid protein [Planctomycetaceae bacterium]|nr:phage major capsid protein [Planctomycetaceae bacterium]